MSNTVTAQELGAFLDAVASAPVALRDVPRMNSILARLVGLANAKHPIGEIVPVEPTPVKHEGTSPDEALPRRRFDAMKKAIDIAERTPLDVQFAALAQAGGTD